MKRSRTGLFAIGAVITLFAVGGLNVAAQEVSEKQLPLVRRVMNLLAEAPAGITPHPTAIKINTVRPGLFEHFPPVLEIASPDEKSAAGTLEGALYIRPAGSVEKKIIAKPDGNWRWDIEGALWSPDGKRIAVKMIDDTDVPCIPIVDWTGKHEKVSMQTYSRVGDTLPAHRLYIVDVASGKTTPVKHGQEFPYFHILDWSADGRAFYFLRSDRLTRNLELLAADAENGEAKPVFRETNKFGALWWKMLQGYDGQMHDAKSVQVLDNGNFIWTSERSGFPHLYLYDQNGKLIRNLTEGKDAGFVQSFAAIDEKRGFVYAVVQGAEEDVYRQTLYRFSLAGGKADKLADGPTMFVESSKDMDKLQVFRTGLPNILEVEEMQNDGSQRKIVWSPDLSFLKEYGFAPEIVKTLAADGKIELRSLLVKPKDFDPKKSYPVLEMIYGGPNANVISNSLPDPRVLSLQQVADRGFVIVLTDGRGTRDRGQEFNNFAAGRFGQVEIADHAAALRELAKTRNYMDLSRVGIFGHSWGGYFTLRALLQEPELYKAGVMLAPGVDTSSMRVALEPYMGCLPADCPANYKAGDNTDKLDKLKAPILIIHGTADDDVPVAEAIKLADALQKAGKKHELILLPGVDHIVQRSPLTYPEIADFFEKHLIKP